jgi:hypothetical protein
MSGGLANVLFGCVCYFMGAIAFLRIFMLQIGKRKSIEYIINTVGTFMSKERFMFK